MASSLSTARTCSVASTSFSSVLRPLIRFRAARERSVAVAAQSHTVTIVHEGTTHKLTVPKDKSILEVALDAGIDLPHDCKLGVCMTCPAKLVSGKVDQSGAMLSDDVEEKGYALLCMAMPQTDCEIMTVSEEELLNEQLCA